MAIRWLLTVIAFFCSSAAAAGASAQSISGDSALVELLGEAASAGSRIRLTAQRSVEGRIAGMSGGIIRLRSGDTVAVARIRQVEIGEKGRSGALWGSLAGTVVLGPPISYFLLDDTGVEVSGINVMGILAGGVLGALAGAIIKPGEVEWNTVWP